MSRCGTATLEPEQVTTASFSGYGNEPPDSIKYGLTFGLAIQLLACPLKVGFMQLVLSVIRAP